MSHRAGRGGSAQAPAPPPAASDDEGEGVLHRLRPFIVDVLIATAGFIVAMAVLWPSLAGDRAFGPFDMWLGFFPQFFELPEGWRDFPRNPLLYDQAFLYAPQQWFIRGSLRDGVFPFWNPAFRCGESLLGTGLGGPLSPFNIPVWCLSWPLGYAWSAVLRVGAMWMGAVFLARALGLSRVWQGALGAGFVLLPPFQVFLQQPLSHAYAWLPWCLWAVERGAGAGDWRASVRGAWPLAPLTVLLFCSGHPHSVFNCVLGVAVYALVRPGLAVGAAAIRLRAAPLAAILIGVMLSGPMVLPFVAQLRGSSTLAERSGGRGAQWTLEARALRTMLDPHALGSPFPGAEQPYSGPVNFAEDQQYVGVVPLVFLVLGAALLRGGRAGHRWRAAALLVMGALGGILAFGVPPLFGLLSAIPPFSMNSNPRLCLLVHVALVGGAALAASGWPRHAPEGSRARLAGGLALLLAAALGACVVGLADAARLPLARGWFAVGASLALFAAGWCGLRGPVARGAACAVLVGLWLADSGRAWLPLHTQPPAEWGDPARARRLLPARLAADANLRVGAEDFTPPNTPVLWGGTDVRAYSLPASARYSAYHTGVMKAANPSNLSAEDLRKPEVLLGLATTAAPWVLTTNEYAPSMAAYVQPVERRGPVRIYRLLLAAEFASWLPATSVAAAPGMDEAVAFLRDNLQRRPEPVVIEGVPPATLSPSAAVGLRWRRPDANRLEVTLPATIPSVPGHAVIRESYDPGWRAHDQSGRELTVRPAQVRFMAVEVPAGTASINMRYRPPGWGAGWALFGAGLVAAIAIGWRVGRP